MKPVARIGDTHVCPAHGTNAIVTGSDSSLCDGRLVARVGDKTACGAVIVSGSGACLTDNKPTAHLGSKTSHGGVITSGSTNQKI